MQPGWLRNSSTSSTTLQPDSVGQFRVSGEPSEYNTADTQQQRVYCVNRTLIIHPVIMFALCLVVAYVTRDALAATAGNVAFNVGFQMSRALAAAIVPLIAVGVLAGLVPKLRRNRIALVIVMWAFWIGLGAMPLAGPILGELGVEFSLMNYNWTAI